jgi:iron complex outermembrane receptor protein
LILAANETLRLRQQKRSFAMSHVNKKSNSLKWLLAGCSVAILLAATSQHSAYAQAQDQSTAAPSGGLEEITVTARKREEKLLDVPIAITALSSKALQEEHIASLQDVATFTPGVTLDSTLSGSNRNDRSFNVYIIRGMNPSSISNPTTSIFIDGAPVTTGQIGGLDGIDRVEVLKGPQSAYFGRETFAGAINVVTKDPSKTFDGDVDVLVGSRNYRDMRGMVEGTLIDDILTARATFRDFARDGSYKNEANPATIAHSGETLGDQSTRSGTLEFVLTPIENLKMKFFGTMYEDDDGPSAQATIYGDSQGNCFGTYVCGVINQSPVVPIAANTKIDSAIANFLANPGGKVNNLLPPSDTVDHFGLHRDAYHVHLNNDYYVEALGFNISTLTAANKQIYSTLIDLDNSDSSSIPALFGQQTYYNWPFLIEGRTFDFSQEVRLTSDQDQRFRWSVGASYLWSKTQSSLTNDGPFGLGVGTVNPSNEQTTIGGFFGLNYDIFDFLTLTFEGRFQVDKEESFNPQGGVLAYTTTSGKVFAKAYNHNFIPRTSLQYKFAPDWMAYATYSEGVNPALSNSSTFGTLTPTQLAGVINQYGVGLLTQPETLKNYEIGVKGRFWDNKATISADIYYDIWSNQIVSNQILFNNVGAAPTLVSPFFNVGKSTLKGVEIDGTVAPIDHVVINGGFAVNDTRIDSYGPNGCAPCQAITGSSYVNGNQLPNASKYQGTLGVKYQDDLAMFEGWQWFARADYIYKSGSYDFAFNLAKTPATNLLNLRAGVESGDIRIEGFIDNATDEKAYTTVLPEYNIRKVGETFSKYDAVTVGLPNLITFGVEAKYNFGGPVEAAETATAAYTPPPVQAPTVAHSYMVFFDFNKSDLTPQAASIVDQAAANAATTKTTQLGVTGYTDTVGSDAYNMRLSRRRAESVAAKLEKDGIPASEIAIVAKGKHDLLVPTADGVKEPQNRRVTIVYGGGASS